MFRSPGAWLWKRKYLSRYTSHDAFYIVLFFSAPEPRSPQVPVLRTRAGLCRKLERLLCKRGRSQSELSIAAHRASPVFTFGPDLAELGPHRSQPSISRARTAFFVKVGQRAESGSKSSLKPREEKLPWREACCARPRKRVSSLRCNGAADINLPATHHPPSQK